MVFIFLAMAAMIVAVIGLNNTGGLLMIPPTTPATFLAGEPHVHGDALRQGVHPDRTKLHSF